MNVCGVTEANVLRGKVNRSVASRPLVDFPQKEFVKITNVMLSKNMIFGISQSCLAIRVNKVLLFLFQKPFFQPTTLPKLSVSSSFQNIN